MLKPLLLASLPMLASPAGNLKIVQATVTWGSGVEPKGELPSASFEARLTLRINSTKINPRFRAWKAHAEDLPALNQGLKGPAMRRAKRLACQATASGKSTWILQGSWPEAPDPGDRLIVEAFWGNHSLGWAATPLTEQALPRLGKPSDDPLE